MRSIFNTNLYRHTDSATDSMNNLCTIVHKLKSEGYYRGEIFMKEHFLGSFRINYNSKTVTPQVNIDVSLFDPTHDVKKGKSNEDLMLEVGMEGYVVLYVSGHQQGVYVKLTRLVENKKAEIYFDSRKLQKGDISVFRVMYPGEYSIQNMVSKQIFAFQIKEEKDGKYAHPSKLQPIMITLTDKGFDTKQTEVAPLQAIIIKAETECVLKLEMKKDKKKVNKKGAVRAK